MGSCIGLPEPILETEEVIEVVLPFPLTIQEARFCLTTKCIIHWMHKLRSMGEKGTLSLPTLIHPRIEAGSPAVFLFLADSLPGTRRMFLHGLASYGCDPAMAVLIAAEAGFETRAVVGKSSETSRPSALLFLQASGATVSASRQKVGLASEKALLSCTRERSAPDANRVGRWAEMADDGSLEETHRAAIGGLLVLSRQKRAILEPDEWLGLVSGFAADVPIARFRTPLPQGTPRHVKAILSCFRRIDIHRRGRVGLADLDIFASEWSDGIGDALVLRMFMESHPGPQVHHMLNPFEFVSLCDAFAVLSDGELFVHWWEWLCGYTRRGGILEAFSTATMPAPLISRRKAHELANRRWRNGTSSDPPLKQHSPRLVQPQEHDDVGLPLERLPKVTPGLYLDLWKCFDRHIEFSNAAKDRMHPDRALVLGLLHLSADSSDQDDTFLSTLSFQDFCLLPMLSDQIVFYLFQFRKLLRAQTGGEAAWHQRRVARAKVVKSARAEKVVYEPIKEASGVAIGSRPSSAGSIRGLRDKLGRDSVKQLLSEAASKFDTPRGSIVTIGGHKKQTSMGGTADPVFAPRVNTAASANTDRDIDTRESVRGIMPLKDPAVAERRGVHNVIQDTLAREAAKAIPGVVQVEIPSLHGKRPMRGPKMPAVRRTQGSGVVKIALQLEDI